MNKKIFVIFSQNVNADEFITLNFQILIIYVQFIFDHMCMKFVCFNNVLYFRQISDKLCIEMYIRAGS